MISRYFDLAEFRSRDGADFPEAVEHAIVYQLAPVLDVIREHVGEPLLVTSGYRSPVHNARVGGAPRSWHLTGLAADLKARSTSASDLHGLIEDLIGEGRIPDGGLGLYASWVHYDLGPAGRRW